MAGEGALGAGLNGAPPPRSPPLAVVLADPDPDYRELALRVLASSVTVQVVGATGDGLELLELTNRLAPRAVVLEVELASLDGFEVVERLRHDGYGGAAVMLSGHQAKDLDLGPPGGPAAAAGSMGGPSRRWPQVGRPAGPIGYRTKRAPITSLAGDLVELVGLLDAIGSEATAAVDLDATSEAPRLARRFVTDHLEDWGQPQSVEVVTLLVSELASNATTHAGQCLQVQLELTPSLIRVEVHDPLDAMPIRREAGQEDIGGRGFDIVERLSTAWGVSLRPSGKCIWFEVPRGAAETPA